MKYKDFGKHYYVLEIENKEVLYSFGSPVALRQNGKIYRLNYEFEKDTGRHIKKYCKDEAIFPLDEEDFKRSYFRILELSRKNNEKRHNA